MTRSIYPAETTTYPSEQLREFSTRVFIHCGVPEPDAMLAADVLATSDLRGIDSHGVARLHTYFDMLSLGRINPRPTVKIVRQSPSTATVDGDNGLGLVVGPKANAIAIAPFRKVAPSSICRAMSFPLPLKSGFREACLRLPRV